MQRSHVRSEKSWKLAVIVDDLSLNEFQAFLLDSVLEKYQASLELVLVPEKKSIKSNVVDRLSKNILLAPSEFLRKKKKNYFSRAKIISVQNNMRPLCEYPEVDLILSLSVENEARGWAEFARFGMLRFQFGESACFYEWASLEKLQKVQLVHYFFREGQCYQNILRDGLVRRYFESLSLHVDGLLSAVSPWLAQAFSENLLQQSLQTETLASEKTERFSISWFRRLGWQGRFLLRAFFRKARRLFLFQTWNIALVKKPISSLLDSQTPFEREWLSLGSSTQFVADPFPVLHDGQLKIFVENYDFRRGKGVVEAISWDQNNNTHNVEAIELPTHISYPSMIVDQGRLYCIPETLGENEVAIYECIRFPNRWQKAKTLLREQMFSDPSLFKHDGKWWMFATRYDRFSGGNDQLFAWHSDSLLGSWTPHALNPIKVDVGSARSAGMPFTVDGVLYRPSQDCRYVYGGAVVINKIQRLTPTEFAEEEITRWLPDANYSEGCHHIAGYGDITVMDGRKEIFSLKAPWIKVSNLLRRREIPRSIISKSEQELNEATAKALDKFKVQTSW